MVPVEIPGAFVMAGAQAAVRWWRWASCALISASSASQRRAMVLRLNLAEAVVEVSGPGRSAANHRISVILPVIASSCSRKAAGALTRIDFRVSIAWLRALTAVSRATLR